MSIRDTQPFFCARNLAIAVGGRTLARTIDIQLGPGECFGVTGPSGSGKTTLLRVLAGLADPVEGQISLEERTPEAWGWPEFRSQVVLVSQAPALIDATVRENLARPFRYAGAQRGFPADEARVLLRRLHLEEAVWDQAARTLSIGQQQRVCIARAALLRPKVFLLDEPTSALDPSAAGAVEALLQEHVKDGAGAVLVSHDPGQQAAWTTRRIDLAEYQAGSAVG